MVSFSKITKHRGFYSKHKHIGLSIKDGKKLYRFLKACFLDFMHAFFHYLGHPPFLVLNAFPDFAHSNAYRLDCVINENAAVLIEDGAFAPFYCPHCKAFAAHVSQPPGN